MAIPLFPVMRPMIFCQNFDKNYTGYSVSGTEGDFWEWGGVDGFQNPQNYPLSTYKAHLH